MKKMLGLALFGLGLVGSLQSGLADYVQFRNSTDYEIVVGYTSDGLNFTDIRIAPGQSSEVMLISKIKSANARYGGQWGGKLGYGQTSLYDNPIDVEALRKSSGSLIVDMNSVAKSWPLSGVSNTIQFNHIADDSIRGAFQGDSESDVLPLGVAWELLGAQGKSYASKALNYFGLRTPTAYEILGVDPTATDSEVKKAFHKLSRQWHPDKHPELGPVATAMFQIIGAAYEQIKTEREELAR